MSKLFETNDISLIKTNDMDPTTFGDADHETQRSGTYDDKDLVPDRVYKERFWVLFLFALCTGINACGWICFAPVFGLVEFVSSFIVVLT